MASGGRLRFWGMDNGKGYQRGRPATHTPVLEDERTVLDAKFPKLMPSEDGQSAVSGQLLAQDTMA